MVRGMLVVLAVVALVPIAAIADPVISYDVSAVNGWFEWGSGSWWPYTVHRYAECWTAMHFAEADSFDHPVYLNAIIRGSGVCSVYVSTDKMVQGLIEAADSFEYFHGAWGNWKAKTSGGQFVGAAALTGGNTYYGWNIDSWFQAHYPNTENGFYIAFKGTGSLTTVYQVWIGRHPTLGVEDLDPTTPRRLSGRASPNPSAGATSIEYSCPRPGAVTARIFDASGRCVRTLLDSERQPAGPNTLHWNGADDAGTRLTSGTYIYRVELPDEVIQGKLVLQ